MSQNDVLQVFISKLQRLKQDNTTFGKAPHKPVVLLSVIHQIERGHILGNHIYLTLDLIAEFIETFRLLGNAGNRPEFTLPFYHLTNEGFWHLQPKSDKILRGYVKSINVLNELNTCSITRMRVTSSHGYQLIDACHIKPISLSYDDTVSNGFALCPNLHRAFDRGIIGVDEKYRVVVSRHIKEETTLSYSLKALEGTKLYLPMPEVHFPRVENFLWHLGERFER
jgi:predicted restriction endonuclease